MVFVLIVHETPRQHHEIAHILVLRAHAQDQRVFDHASAKADAVVGFEHGRRCDDARNLGQDGLFIVAGEGVVIEHTAGTRGSAARVFHLYLVGPDLLDFIQDELLAG